MELRMNQKERDRLKVVGQVQAGKLSQQAAADVLDLSTRQVRRVVRRVEGEGDAGVMHRLRDRASNHRLPGEVREQAVRLIEAQYRDYGPTLASEVLTEEHGIE